MEMDGRPGPNTRDYKRPRALNVTWSLRQAQFLKLSLDFHGRYIYIYVYICIYMAQTTGMNLSSVIRTYGTSELRIKIV